MVTELGSTVLLTCEMTKPVKSVKWYRNGKEIWPRFHKLRMSVQETIALLEISSFEASDQGEYVAALREDEKSASAKVELRVAPSIKVIGDVGIDVMKLHAGTDFVAELAYEGFPEPTIEAILNDKPLDVARFRMHTYDDKLSLRIRTLTREDSGVLKIVAVNDVGRVSEEIRLNVVDVPSEPLNLTHSNVTSRSVLLRWEKPSKNGGSPITSYIVERRTADIRRWRNVGKCDAQQHEFLVDELFPSESYGFRTVAVNEVGEGLPSSVVDVLTKSESVELAELAEEAKNRLQTPNRPEATLSKDDRTILLAWEVAEDDVDEYIIERVEHDRKWKRIGVSEKPMFEDSVDGSLTYVYRVIARKDDHESSPSEPSAELTLQVPDEITVEAKTAEDEIARIFLEAPEMIEEKIEKPVEEKDEKPQADEKDKPEKKKKVLKRTKKGEEKKVETDDHTKDNVETEEKLEVITKEDQEKDEVERKPKKLVKKKKRSEIKPEDDKKLEADKTPEERSEEREKIQNFEEESKAEEKLGELLEKKKSDVRSETEKRLAEKVTDLEKDKAEKELEEKVEGRRRESKTISEAEKEKGHEKGTKKLVAKKKPSEKAEELVPQAQREEQMAVVEKLGKEAKKLEVKTVESSVFVAHGTKNFELRVEISGECTSCLWTKDGVVVDKKLVETCVSASVLRIDNVDELTAGNYLCTVTNETDEASASIDVTVTGSVFTSF